MAEFDLVVRGGNLADGTGAAIHEADVAVKDGKIAAVGKVAGKGAEEIDAKGLLVTPGFVDIHTLTTGRRPGIRIYSRRAGTASPPQSWAIAALDLRR